MPALVVKNLGHTDYHATFLAMQTFTANRHAETADELWLTSHDPIYTLGINVRLPQNNIPLVQVDRGGKITYHGPGQVVIYTLIDCQQRQIKVRELVSLMESSIQHLLAEYGVIAHAKPDAPGVYVGQQKIASVGLRFKNQCAYHGLSLNVEMDLSPFKAIDPCGYVGLEVTQTSDLGITDNTEQIGNLLIKRLEEKLNEWPKTHR
jgi:lipoyl(octanoyl) transferase